MFSLADNCADEAALYMEGVSEAFVAMLPA